MSQRAVLLMSSSRVQGFSYLEHAKEQLTAFLGKKNVQTVLFVPYALRDHDDYTAQVDTVLRTWGYNVEGLHTKSNPIEAIRAAEAIFVGGGNTFVLLKTLYEKNLVDVIRSRVLEAGTPYIGSSAGTNVATRSIHTTNDMPVVYPPTFDALQLVPFNINPHYVDDAMWNRNSGHKGETRNQRLQEFVDYNNLPVLGIPEGCSLLVEGDKASLLGGKNASVFKPFIKNYRLSKAAFMDLLTDISPYLSDGLRNTSVPRIVKLCTALSIFAQGSYQLSVGKKYSHGLAQATVSKAFTDVIDVLETHICHKWINFKYTKAETQRAKTFFLKESGIPGVIACISGTYIKIRLPNKKLQYFYKNRNGFFSINAMFVCDDEMKIRYVNATHPGASHDSMVFKMSKLKKHLDQEYEHGEGTSVILGDAGYPLKPYLLTPFRAPKEGSVESVFNQKHAKAWRIIERTIYVLKNRFRCLLGEKALHYSPRKTTKIINVCVALHNICKFYNVPDEDISPENIASIHDDKRDVTNIITQFDDAEAEQIRNKIARSFFL